MNVALDHHDSRLGRWTLAMWRPPPGSRLASAVEGVWCFEGQMGLLRERHFPLGTLDLVLHLGPVYRHVRADGTCDPYPRACCTGLLTGTDVVEAPPEPSTVLGFRLRPVGAFRLLRRPIHSLTDHTVPLQDLLGPQVERLEASCRLAESPQAQVQAAVSWMRERLGPAPEPEVEWAVRRICGSRGTVAIGELHDTIGGSRSRFTQSFREQVGLTPKHFARIHRFRRALELVARHETPLVDVALDCGYYDQAHFTGEFRRLSGFTPSEYRRSLRFPESVSVAEAAG